MVDLYFEKSILCDVCTHLMNHCHGILFFLAGISQDWTFIFTWVLSIYIINLEDTSKKLHNIREHTQSMRACSSDQRGFTHASVAVLWMPPWATNAQYFPWLVRNMHFLVSLSNSIWKVSMSVSSSWLAARLTPERDMASAPWHEHLTILHA